ncbi:hypothetical protein QBC43DRAFT_141811 [Cladorrhinum sp. PSN259]|nr:hypothetical protein QBC43DRAFT_141811 [Cladorrhinum sp. PSN259]
MEGIEYLRKVRGVPRFRHGCDRMSCSWGAAVYWCNADDNVKTLDSWHNIADGALDILNTCGGTSSGVADGVRSYADGCAVIVKGLYTCSGDGGKDWNILRWFRKWRNEYPADKRRKKYQAGNGSNCEEDPKNLGRSIDGKLTIVGVGEG